MTARIDSLDDWPGESCLNCGRRNNNGFVAVDYVSEEKGFGGEEMQLKPISILTLRQIAETTNTDGVIAFAFQRRRGDSPSRLTWAVYGGGPDETECMRALATYLSEPMRRGPIDPWAPPEGNTHEF